MLFQPKKGVAYADPYDTLPKKVSSTRDSIEEPPPPSPTISVYANCYENFPTSSFTSDSNIETSSSPTPTPQSVHTEETKLSHAPSLKLATVNGRQQRFREDYKAIELFEGAEHANNETHEVFH